MLAGFVTDAPDRLTGYRTREFAVLLSGLGTVQIALLRAITG